MFELFKLKQFNPEDKLYCNGAAALGSAAIGAAGSIFGSSKASDAQVKAAEIAAAEARRQYDQTRKDLSPYRELGTEYAGKLDSRMDFLTSPITMDQATLEKTPGYQWNLRQGLRGVQNSAAMRGLGVSGAALKGATAFATGLADSTYQTQFNLENINRTNEYNRLKGLVDTGLGAATQTGVFGAQAAKQIGDAAIGAGNAQAAAYNSMGNAFNKFANDAGGYAAYRGIYG